MNVNLMRFSVFFAIVALMFACSGPEEKKMKFYVKGKALYEKGDYIKARLELKNAIQIDKNFSDAYALLGMVELKQGNLKGSFSAFSKATEINPINFDAQIQLGKLWLLRGDQVKAKEKAEMVLKVLPQHEEGLFLRVALYLAEKDTERAINLLKEMSKKGVKRAELFLLLASAYRQAGFNFEAEKALKEGLNQNSRSQPLRLALAEIYARSGRIEESIGELRQLIVMEPSNINYSISLAALYWDNGQEPLARQIMAKLTTANLAKEDCILAVAGFYLSRKSPSDAERLLLSGLAANKGSFPLRFALADIYINSGRSDKGINQLKDCLALEKDESRPRIIETKNTLARIYMGIGEYEKTTKLLEEILKLSPHNLEANLSKGRLAMLKGEGDKAIAAFQIIVNDKPKAIQGYLLLADAQLQNKKPAMALDSLLQAQKLEPDSRQVQRALARYYVQQGDFPTAEEHLRYAISKNPDDLDIQIDLGDLFRSNHDTKQAKAVFAGIKNNRQGAVIGRVKLSDLYLETGKPDMAIAELNQALNLAPQSGEIFTKLIRIYSKQHKYAEAMTVCQKRISSRPKEVLSYLLLSDIQKAQGEYGKAEEILLLAQKSVGCSLQITLLLGQLQVKAGELMKARRTYEEFLVKEPDSWAAANDYACMLADYGNGKNDLQKALSLAKRVSTRFPSNPIIMDTLGWVYYRLGDFRKSAELLEISATKLNNNPLFRYHAGMALFRAGRFDKARAHLQFAAASRFPFAGREEAMEILRRN